jgi:hypothetical protein
MASTELRATGNRSVNGVYKFDSRGSICLTACWTADRFRLRERVLNSASCNYYFIRDLFSARSRVPAELIEHTVQQDGATLVNQVNFVFVAKHFLD